MEKTCRLCIAPFIVYDEDIALLERLAPQFGGRQFAIPLPTLCPICRWQRRLAFRNERSLYYRSCSTCKKRMFSMYPEDTPFPVMHIEEWISDSWEACDYGRTFDFRQPFFEQFFALCAQVPHFNLNVLPQSDINSEYTNCAGDSKNCYLISQAEFNQDCYYSRGINSCADCVDCLRVEKCEQCYECVSCNDCQLCFWCSECENSSNCRFSTNLQGCKDCFGCHGLVHRRYCIYNREVSAQQYAAFLKSIAWRASAVEEIKQKAAVLHAAAPRRATRLLNCEDCFGDGLKNSRSCYQVFDSKDLEHCRYCQEVSCSAVHCMDITMPGLNTELMYDCIICHSNCYHILFSNLCYDNTSSLLYCDSCRHGTRSCFGCCGLSRKSHCVLNRAYTAHEYDQLAARIIGHMRETGEWGEFFPPQHSPFGYNETIAAEFFPLSEADARKAGFNWRDDSAPSTTLRAGAP